jgi:hypothetical protein
MESVDIEASVQRALTAQNRHSTHQWKPVSEAIHVAHE